MFQTENCDHELYATTSEKHHQVSSKRNSLVKKHNKVIRIVSSDLTPYVQQSFGFIDPDFPHAVCSLIPTDQPENSNVVWIPAQHLVAEPTYSNKITAITSNLFCKPAISHGLTLINWFAPEECSELLNQEISQNHIYRFDVLKEGIFTSVAIDSYIPVDAVSKLELYSKNHYGSIFPCLYEKMLAKIYGDYQSISSQFIEIVELQTGFCREQVSLTRGITSQQLKELLSVKIKQGSVVCLRTRNSIRLESLGLQSNHLYVLLRVIQREEGDLVEFLELEGTQWIGKMSKKRSDWLLESQLVQKEKIVLEEGTRQNYMTITDLQGLGRELVILNRTTEYHKNHYSCLDTSQHFSMYRLTLHSADNLYLRVNYQHIRCYNSLLLLRHASENEHTLLMSQFHENKDSCFMEAELQAGQYCLLVYNYHSQQSSLPYNLTLFSKQQFIEIVPVTDSHTIQNALSNAFKQQLKKYIKQKSPVLLKHLYPTTGLAFLYAHPSHKLLISINRQMLEEAQVYEVNRQRDRNELIMEEEKIKQEGWKNYEVRKGEELLIIYCCLWSRKENIAFDYETKREVEKITFPPVGSIKITQRRSLQS